MRKALLLAGAIGTEIAGTMTLRAVIDHLAWTPLVVLAYLIAYSLLALTLRAGMPIGVAYGIWGATGVALTAVLGAVLFGESLGVPIVVGIGLIVVGVVLVQTGAHSEPEACS